MWTNLDKSSHPYNQWTSAVTIARVSACLTSAQELAVRDVLLLTGCPGDQLRLICGGIGWKYLYILSHCLLDKIGTCQELPIIECELKMVKCWLTDTSLKTEAGRDRSEVRPHPVTTALLGAFLYHCLSSRKMREIQNEFLSRKTREIKNWFFCIF